MALVRPIPIDLWPLNFISIVDSSSPPKERTYRCQHDLEFVRKQLATGILATCKLIFNEASNMFWSENTFRFSGDVEWFGVRRFLGSIGPRALSQLSSLEVFAPVVEVCCLDTSLFDGGDSGRRKELYTNIREAKNKPKMRMVKARKEPWSGSFWTMNGHLTTDNAEYALTRNIDHVCYLLQEAKASLPLNLIIPKLFGLNAPH